MSGITWNIDDYKRQKLYIDQIYEHTDFHTMMLQEINLDTAEAPTETSSLNSSLTATTNCHDYRANFSHQMAIRKAITKKATGTAVIINNTTSYQILPLDTKTFTNVSASISKNKGETLVTIGLYCPTTGNKIKDNQFEDYLTKVEVFTREILDKHPSAHLIVVADWNINQKSASKRRLAAYERFKNTFLLSEAKPERNTYFSKSKRGGVSLIDWILTSKDVTVTSIRTITRDEVPHSGDHMPVVYTVNIPLRTENTDNNTDSHTAPSNKNYINRKKINWDLVDRDLYQLLSRHFIKLVMNEIKNTCSPPLQLKIISDQLSLAAQLASRQPEKEIQKKKSSDMCHYEIKLTKNNNLIRKICIKKNLDTDITIPELKKILKEEHSEAINILKNLKIERLELRSKLREATNNWIKEQVNTLNAEIDKILATQNIERLYSEFKKLDKKSSVGPPDEIKYMDKIYKGEQVLQGFETLTRVRSKNTRVGDTEDEHYKHVKAITDGLSELYGNSKHEIKPMDKDKFKDVLQSLPLKKAEDINNVTLENILHTDEETLEIIRTLTNKIVMNWEEYSSVIFNTVKATMLYKGKGKPRDNPMSYRRISVGNVLQKVIDRYMSEETQPIAKAAQGSSQYGFTKGVNFLLLSILRENVQKYATEFKKTMICFATDITDAFSQTCRESQLYECYLAGETEKIWKYTEATYRETHTVLCEGNRMGTLIEEEKGSRQGGIKSATDFKLYYLCLDRMLRAADLGYKIEDMDEKLFLQLVADDGMSWISTVEELQAVIQLFEHYASSYKMAFSFPKTLINVYGSKEQIDAIRSNKGIKVAGNDPLFPEEAQHLGLIQCQDITKTEEVNVRERIRKATIKFYSLFGQRFKSHTPIRTEIAKMIWNVYIKPTLLTGLNALVVEKESLKLLKDFEATVLRAMFKVRKGASLIPLFQMSGIEPIEATLHKSCFSLFHNVWMNPETPSSKFCKIILQNPEKYKFKYWPKHIQALAARYKIPDPAKLIERKHPEKETWKRYVAKKIETHHQKILEKQILSHSTTTFLNDTSLHKYIKTGHRFLQTPRDTTEVNAAHIKALILAGEYPTQVHEKRVRGKKQDSDDCKHCKTETDAARDTTIHMLEFCPITKTERSQKARTDIYKEYAAATDRCPSSLDNYFRLNPGSYSTFILNPTHKSLPKSLQVTSYHATRSFVNSLSQYCWTVHHQRLKSTKARKATESQRDGDGPPDPDMPDGEDRDKETPEGKQRKITKFFQKKDASESDSDHSDYTSDTDSDGLEDTSIQTQSNFENFQILKDRSKGLPPSHSSSQLLGVILNPGTCVLQGTIFPGVRPGYKFSEPKVLFRNYVTRNSAPFAYSGAVELFSQSKSLMEAVVCLTTEEFSSRDLREIFTQAKIKTCSTVVHCANIPPAEPTDMKITTTILALERGSNHPEKIQNIPPRQVYIWKLNEKDPLPGMCAGYNAYFLTEEKEIKRETFAREEDYRKVKDSKYIGSTVPIEILEDYRTQHYADRNSTMLILRWERGDEEGARTASLRITEADPTLYPHLVQRLTCPHTVTASGPVSAYARKIIEVDNAGKLFIGEEHFRNQERILDDIRMRMKYPSQISTAYRVTSQYDELLSKIEQVSITLDKIMMPKDPNDLRNIIERKERREDLPPPPPAKKRVKSRLGNPVGSSQLTLTQMVQNRANPASSDECDGWEDCEEDCGKDCKTFGLKDFAKKKIDEVDLTRSTSSSSSLDVSHFGQKLDISNLSNLLEDASLPICENPLPGTPRPKYNKLVEQTQRKNLQRIKAWKRAVLVARREHPVDLPQGWEEAINTCLENFNTEPDISEKYPRFNTHVVDSPPPAKEISRYFMDFVLDNEVNTLEESFSIGDIPVTAISEDESFHSMLNEAREEQWIIYRRKKDKDFPEDEESEGLENITAEESMEEDCLELSAPGEVREVTEEILADKKNQQKKTSTPKVLEDMKSTLKKFVEESNLTHVKDAKHYSDISGPICLCVEPTEEKLQMVREQVREEAEEYILIITEDLAYFVKKVSQCSSDLLLSSFMKLLLGTTAVIPSSRNPRGGTEIPRLYVSQTQHPTSTLFYHQMDLASFILVVICAISVQLEIYVSIIMNMITYVNMCQIQYFSRTCDFISSKRQHGEYKSPFLNKYEDFNIPLSQQIKSDGNICSYPEISAWTHRPACEANRNIEMTGTAANSGLHSLLIRPQSYTPPVSTLLLQPVPGPHHPTHHTVEISDSPHHNTSHHTAPHRFPQSTVDKPAHRLQLTPPCERERTCSFLYNYFVSNTCTYLFNCNSSLSSTYLLYSNLTRVTEK